MNELFESITMTRWLLLLSMAAVAGFSTLLVKDLWREKHLLRWPLAILIIGLALRIGWIGFSQPEPLSDFLIYWQYANAFFSGDMTYAELSRHPGVIVFYSWFFEILGPTLFTGWIMNLLFAALLMLLVYALGRDIFGHGAGVLAMALTAILPQFITYTALFASETPAIACFLLILWAVLRTRQHPAGLPYWAALGVLLYGTILLRSSSMIFLGLIPMLIVFFRRDQLKPSFTRFAVMALTTVILLSTWVAHQNAIGGSPKLFWGTELWLSCAIQYDRGGRYTHPKDMAFYDKVKPYYEMGTQQGLIQAYAVIGGESMKVIRQDPAKYLLFGFTRMKNILWTSQTGIRWSQKGAQGPLATLDERWVKKMANVSNIFWQILLCLSPLGLFAFRRKGSDIHQEGWLFLAAFSVIWLVFHFLVAVASERYAFQLIPFVILMGTGGLFSLFALLRELAGAREESTSTVQV